MASLRGRIPGRGTVPANLSGARLIGTRVSCPRLIGTNARGAGVISTGVISTGVISTDIIVADVIGACVAGVPARPYISLMDLAGLHIRVEGVGLPGVLGNVAAQ